MSAELLTATIVRRETGAERWVIPVRRSRVIAIALVALLLSLFSPLQASANHDVGPDRVYFPETGHYLAFAFLDFWHHNGDITILGYPISEELKDPVTNQTIQYFERAVLEWDDTAPAGEGVQLRRLGADAVANRASQSAFRRVNAASDDNTTFFQETGHRLSSGFRTFWEENGGLPIFGYPLSEEFKENGLTVQYFERARFEWHPENQGTLFEIQLGHLGTQAAEKAKVNRAPVPQSDEVSSYDPGLWYVPEPPTPVQVTAPPPGSPTGQAKWIEVDLSNQYLRAWENSTVVFGEYISSGTYLHPTPTGYFSVFTKLQYDDMTNGIAAPPGEYYYLPDVPWTMYFAAGGYAIHGTYWHSNFGTPMSHGCVNMTISGANWLYNWTPYGTTVWVHY